MNVLSLKRRRRSTAVSVTMKKYAPDGVDVASVILPFVGVTLMAHVCAVRR
jgi:hypothetical protein